VIKVIDSVCRVPGNGCPVTAVVIFHQEITQVKQVKHAVQGAGSRTAWAVSTVPWRRTPWVIGVLGRGTDGKVVVVDYSV